MNKNNSKADFPSTKVQINQLNGNKEWGNSTRQCNRFYSIYSGSPTLMGSLYPSILELYPIEEK